jgi:hypothetical protein
MRVPRRGGAVWESAAAVRAWKQANVWMNAYRAVAGLVLACALGATAAACGSTPVPHAAPTPKTSPPGIPPVFHSSLQIRSDWAKFFTTGTPVSERIKLLQDGPEFSSIIGSLAHSPLAAHASAMVTKVVLLSATRASVTYSILESGKTVLPDQTGVAVYSGGTWKVGVASFCRLLALEDRGKTSSLPACKTAV